MSESALRANLYAIGAIQIVAAIVMFVSPGTFFDQIGEYGVRNDHYIGDEASFLLAAGIAFLVAARRRSWRVPLLFVGALGNGFHALNHLFDIGEASSDARGIFDTVSLALLALGAAYLARVSARLSSSPGETQAAYTAASDRVESPRR